MNTGMRKLMSEALHNGPRRLADYFPTKGGMIEAISTNLAVVGYTLDDTDCMDLPGDEGHKLLAIVDVDCNEEVGYIHCSWYRMPSGRYECTAYVT